MAVASQTRRYLAGLGVIWLQKGGKLGTAKSGPCRPAAM
jgi:hypothetical protein